MEEAMPDQPDELTGELRGVADHFLSRETLVLGAVLSADVLVASDFVLFAADGLEGD